jgi:hypothetical protein
MTGGQCIARGIPSGQVTPEVPNPVTDLSQSNRRRLERLLLKYHDCFVESNAELRNANVEMEIVLTDSTPVFYRPYRLSFHERETVRNIVDIIEKQYHRTYNVRICQLNFISEEKGWCYANVRGL